MSTTTTCEWLSEWGDDSAIELAFRYVPAAERPWQTGVRQGLTHTFRSAEIGLADASGGEIKLQHIQGGEDVTSFRADWHLQDHRLQFFYVRRGTFTIEVTDGEQFVLVEGSAGFGPPLCWHREHDFSADFDLLEATAPLAFHTVDGLGNEMIERAGGGDPTRRHFVTHETPEAYRLGKGDWGEFLIRDIGVADPGDAHFRARVVRAAAGTGDLAWPTSRLGRMVHILGGTARTTDPQGRALELATGDTVYLPAGYGGGRCARGISALELCFPVPGAGG